MKWIFVIIDGAADNGKNTSFETANTPNLDYLTSKSKVGLMYTVGKGIAPESDTAVISLLGNKIKNYTGRGPFEAYGFGIKLKENEIAFRANFASFENGNLIDRRVGRLLKTSEAKELAKIINRKVKFDDKDAYFKFYSTIEHRGVLIIGHKKKKLCPKVSNVDVGYKIVNGVPIASKESKVLSLAKPLSPRAKRTADLVNEFFIKAREVLNDAEVNKKREKKGLLPANGILIRGAGNKLYPMKNINELTGKHWAAIVGMPLEKGIARNAGMDLLSFDYPEIRTYDIYRHLHRCLCTEIKNAKEKIKKYWNKYDAFYVHFKETDIPGHDGLKEEKVKMIEKIDKKFFSFARKLDARVIVTCDHATPTTLKRHSDDPVPIMITGESDGIDKFGENYFKEGSLHFNHGYELMKYLVGVERNENRNCSN